MRAPHVHKEVLIAYANGAWVEWKNDENEWEIIENPNFFEDEEYRVKPEREYPVTSLTADELGVAYDSATSIGEAPYFRLRCVANAAIKQYILDTECAK